MANKQLVSKINNVPTTKTLTSHIHSYVKIVFSNEIDKKYSLEKMQSRDAKQLTDFLYTATQLTWNDFEKKYTRKDYHNPEGEHHYTVSDSFRLYGIIENEYLKVTKIDPNHKYNGK